MKMPGFMLGFLATLGMAEQNRSQQVKHPEGEDYTPIPKREILPKGAKRYYFNAEGIEIDPENPAPNLEDYHLVFTTLAINSKRALEKFKKAKKKGRF